MMFFNGKKKKMTPEERKIYEALESYFFGLHFKKYVILFSIWLVVLIVGYVLEFTGHWNFVLSLLHLLWSLSGLTCTIIFNHHSDRFAMAHLHDPVRYVKVGEDDAEATEETAPDAEHTAAETEAPAADAPIEDAAPTVSEAPAPESGSEEK